MGDNFEERVDKIEAFLNEQLSYKPNIESRDGKGSILQSLTRIELALFGDSSSMGIQTRVRFMWWANYTIGFAAGSFCTILFQKLFS